MQGDLEVLTRRVESARRYLRGPGVLPDLALEAIEDISRGLTDFAARWLEGLTPEQRRHMAASLDAHDQLQAEIDRIAADIKRRRDDP